MPDDLTIGYFYHPFRGETFETVLRNIVDSIDRQPRRVRLIYVTPADRRKVARHGQDFGSSRCNTTGFSIIERFGLEDLRESCERTEAQARVALPHAQPTR